MNLFDLTGLVINDPKARALDARNILASQLYLPKWTFFFFVTTQSLFEKKSKQAPLETMFTFVTNTTPFHGN